MGINWAYIKEIMPIIKKCGCAGCSDRTNIYCITQKYEDTAVAMIVGGWSDGTEEKTYFRVRFYEGIGEFYEKTVNVRDIISFCDRNGNKIPKRDCSNCLYCIDGNCNDEACAGCYEDPEHGNYKPR